MFCTKEICQFLVYRKNARVTYLEPIDEQKCISIDRQIAIADVSHRCDWYEGEAHGDHAVAEESAIGGQNRNPQVGVYRIVGSLTMKSSANPPRLHSRKPDIRRVR
jgi:hypothetical protein